MLITNPDIAYFKYQHKSAHEQVQPTTKRNFWLKSAKVTPDNTSSTPVRTTRVHKAIENQTTDNKNAESNHYTAKTRATANTKTNKCNNKHFRLESVSKVDQPKTKDNPALTNTYPVSSVQNNSNQNPKELSKTIHYTKSYPFVQQLKKVTPTVAVAGITLDQSLSTPIPKVIHNHTDSQQIHSHATLSVHTNSTAPKPKGKNKPNKPQILRRIDNYTKRCSTSNKIHYAIDSTGTVYNKLLANKVYTNPHVPKQNKIIQHTQTPTNYNNFITNLHLQNKGSFQCISVRSQYLDYNQKVPVHHNISVRNSSQKLNAKQNTTQVTPKASSKTTQKVQNTTQSLEEQKTPEQPDKYRRFLQQIEGVKPHYTNNYSGHEIKTDKLQGPHNNKTTNVSHLALDTTLNLTNITSTTISNRNITRNNTRVNTIHTNSIELQNNLVADTVQHSNQLEPLRASSHNTLIIDTSRIQEINCISPVATNIKTSSTIRTKNTKGKKSHDPQHHYSYNYFSPLSDNYIHKMSSTDENITTPVHPSPPILRTTFQDVIRLNTYTPPPLPSTNGDWTLVTPLREPIEHQQKIDKNPEFPSVFPTTAAPKTTSQIDDVELNELGMNINIKLTHNMYIEPKKLIKAMLAVLQTVDAWAGLRPIEQGNIQGNKVLRTNGDVDEISTYHYYLDTPLRKNLSKEYTVRLKTETSIPLHTIIAQPLVREWFNIERVTAEINNLDSAYLSNVGFLQYTTPILEHLNIYKKRVEKAMGLEIPKFEMTLKTIYPERAQASRSKSEKFLKTQVIMLRASEHDVFTLTKAFQAIHDQQELTFFPWMEYVTLTPAQKRTIIITQDQFTQNHKSIVIKSFTSEANTTPLMTASEEEIDMTDTTVNTDYNHSIVIYGIPL